VILFKLCAGPVFGLDVATSEECGAITKEAGQVPQPQEATEDLAATQVDPVGSIVSGSATPPSQHRCTRAQHGVSKLKFYIDGTIQFASLANLQQSMKLLIAKIVNMPWIVRFKPSTRTSGISFHHRARQILSTLSGCLKSRRQMVQLIDTRHVWW
jgi:hypothetical protein